MVKSYGLEFPDGTTQAAIEIKCFDAPWMREHSGLSKYDHLHRAIDLLWNEPRRRHAAERRTEYDERKHDAFIWNDWTELMMQALCEGHWATTIWGPNSSWKTTTVAVYALCSWFASPSDTIVVLTSTSLPGLRKRIWKEITRFYRWSNTGFAHVNNTDFAIRFQKGSDEAGIFGIPTGQDDGDIQKAVDKIIGFHAKHVLASVDEMQATNQAIVKGTLSLEAGADRFQFIGMGNPDTELDALGQMSEPVRGYDTINPDMDRWETKRGICVHLDGLQSPRVIEGDEYYPGLLTQADINSAITNDGEDSPEFWRTRRGFIAPQGATRTVLSSAIIKKFKAREKAIWTSGFVMGAGLDPAFEGGDRCMLRFGKCGQMIDGKTGIELNELVQIKVSATSDEPIHFQIARQVKDLCEQHEPPVAPENMSIDSSGEGGGLASILQREWSPAITLVEFGGRASDLPVSEHNQKPSNQEYLYRVTELWYQFRILVQNGQIRGLDNDTAIEFCQRTYQMRGNLKMLESKSDMKARVRKSPDLADATVVLTEMFRQTQNLMGQGRSSGGPIDDRWSRFHAENSLDDEDAYLIEA